MTPEEYIKNAIKTAPLSYPDSSNAVSRRAEHAILGIAAEAGELLDYLKKARSQGREIKKEELISDAGDVMWYLAILAYELDVPFSDLWEYNIDKLKKRFPEGFDKDIAKSLY